MRGSSLFTFILFIASTITAMPSFARDFYVDNVQGDDRNDGLAQFRGTSGSGPFKTIARALRKVDGGDRVFLAKNADPYRESITLEGRNCSGNSFQAFQLIGNGATLDGSTTIGEEAWEHFAGNVFRFRPDRPKHQILFLDARPLPKVDANNRQQLSSLEPLHWALHQNHIYFCVEQDKLPSSYNLSCCGHSVGITLYQVHGVVISDLTVQGFQLDGVNAHDLVSNAHIQSSTLRGNGRSGVSIGGASRFRIESCLIGNNGNAQVRTEGFSRTELKDCDLVENQEAWRIERDGGKLTFDGHELDQSWK